MEALIALLISLVASSGRKSTFRHVTRKWANGPNLVGLNPAKHSLAVKWDGGVSGIAVVCWTSRTAAILPGTDPRWPAIARAVEAKDYQDWKGNARALLEHPA